MATRAGVQADLDLRAAKITWSGLLNADVGAGVDAVRLSDKTVQVFGTFGAAGAVQLQGSADGGTTWGRLHDAQGVLLSIINNEAFLIAENPMLIRPFVAAGDGTTNLTVVLVAHKKD